MNDNNNNEPNINNENINNSKDSYNMIDPRSNTPVITRRVTRHDAKNQSNGSTTTILFK
jgi:hypothetical protein